LVAWPTILIAFVPPFLSPDAILGTAEFLACMLVLYLLAYWIFVKLTWVGDNEHPSDDA